MKSKKLIVEKGIWVYAHYFCKRCGKRIRWYASHSINGIPTYHLGHNYTSTTFKKGKDHPMFGKYHNDEWKAHQSKGLKRYYELQNSN